VLFVILYRYLFHKSVHFRRISVANRVGKFYLPLYLHLIKEGKREDGSCVNDLH